MCHLRQFPEELSLSKVKRVLCYAKRGAKQTVYTGIQENGYRDHDGRKTELSGNSKTIWGK